MPKNRTALTLPVILVAGALCGAKGPSRETVRASAEEVATTESAAMERAEAAELRTGVSGMQAMPGGYFQRGGYGGGGYGCGCDACDGGYECGCDACGGDYGGPACGYGCGDACAAGPCRCG